LSPTPRSPLDGRAYALMVGCGLLWGLQQVAVKVALLVGAGIVLVNAPRARA